MTKKSLNLFTILFFTFIFLLNACDTTTDDTEKQEDTKIVSPSESTNDNEEKKDETEPRIVGIWQTEEEFNSQKGFSFAYEITADNKITSTMTYIYDVLLSPDEEPIITEGQYMKLTGKVSSVTESVIKVTDMKVSADSTISSDIITQMIGDLSASNSVEIEYKDLTKSSVKILNTEIDENDNEIETWITLVKVGKSTENDNTGNNDNNNDNNTEYSIIGTWTGIKNLNTGDFSIDFKITYVITEKNFTLIFENITTDEDLKITQTTESTITKFEENKIYLISDNPENPGEKINSTFNYKDLTADSVKIYLEGYNEWITFKKVTNTNNNENNDNGDNKDDDTEYSIIGSWGFTQTIENTDGTSMEMKITYVITVDKITSYAEVNGQNSTSEMTITKIENGKIYCTGLSPVDNTTEVTSIIVYKDLTANSVKITTVENCEDDVWLTFTKKTNTNNNDNKNDNTEYSIIGSWGFTQTIENTDGTSMEMKVTYVITADKITSYAEVNGQNSTSEMTITKIENGKIYCTGLSPVDNTTEIESILMYKDLTADSVKITTYSVEESDTWIIFTKIN